MKPNPEPIIPVREIPGLQQRRPAWLVRNESIKRQERYKPYWDRNALLKQLGYASYGEYLDSPLWKDIRRKVLKEQPNCASCRRRAYVVHHMEYSKAVLLGEDTRPLKALCRVCHDQCEFGPRRRKRGLGEANGVLQKLRTKGWKRRCDHCKKNYTKRGHTLCGACKNIAPG